MLGVDSGVGIGVAGTGRGLGGTGVPPLDEPGSSPQAARPAATDPAARPRSSVRREICLDVAIGTNDSPAPPKRESARLTFVDPDG